MSISEQVNTSVMMYYDSLAECSPESKGMWVPLGPSANPYIDSYTVLLKRKKQRFFKWKFC